MAYRLTDSGYYTPTEDAGASSNLASVTFYDAMYTRVGQIMNVSGRLEATATATGLAQVGIVLVIPSNIAGLEGVSGTAFSVGGIPQGGVMHGNATENCAVLEWEETGGVPGVQDFYYSYQYMII